MKIIIEGESLEEIKKFVETLNVQESKPKEFTDLNNLSVNEMGLPTRVSNMLEKYGITKFGQLIDLRRKKQFIGSYNGEMITLNSLEEIERKCSPAGPKTVMVIKRRLEAVQGW
jgi:DNA-directed RNA polymerase alpha subunit